MSKEVYFNEVHIHRKTKYNQDTLKFLSIFHHRVWQLPFTTILTEFILKTSYFQWRSRSKRSTFQRKNEPSRWCKSWEKLKKLWTKHHRVTLVKADIPTFEAIYDVNLICWKKIINKLNQFRLTLVIYQNGFRIEYPHWNQILVLNRLWKKFEMVLICLFRITSRSYVVC